MTDPVTTLVVDATTYDMMHGDPRLIEPNIRIYGNLPTVTDLTDDEYAEAMRWRDWDSIRLADRPLRKGDRVTLVTECGRCEGDGFVCECYPAGNDGEDRACGSCPDCNVAGTVPFATATVANIVTSSMYNQDDSEGYVVTITNVVEDVDS